MGAQLEGTQIDFIDTNGLSPQEDEFINKLKGNDYSDIKLDKDGDKDLDNDGDVDDIDLFMAVAKKDGNKEFIKAIEDGNVSIEDLAKIKKGFLMSLATKVNHISHSDNFNKKSYYNYKEEMVLEKSTWDKTIKGSNNLTNQGDRLNMANLRKSYDDISKKIIAGDLLVITGSASSVDSSASNAHKHRELTMNKYNSNSNYTSLFKMNKVIRIKTENNEAQMVLFSDLINILKTPEANLDKNRKVTPNDIHATSRLLDGIMTAFDSDPKFISKVNNKNPDVHLEMETNSFAGGTYHIERKEEIPTDPTIDEEVIRDRRRELKSTDITNQSKLMDSLANGNNGVDLKSEIKNSLNKLGNQTYTNIKDNIESDEDKREEFKKMNTKIQNFKKLMVRNVDRYHDGVDTFNFSMESIKEQYDILMDNINKQMEQQGRIDDNTKNAKENMEAISLLIQDAESDLIGKIIEKYYFISDEETSIIGLDGTEKQVKGRGIEQFEGNNIHKVIKYSGDLFIREPGEKYTRVKEEKNSYIETNGKPIFTYVPIERNSATNQIEVISGKKYIGRIGQSVKYDTHANKEMHKILIK